MRLLHCEACCTTRSPEPTILSVFWLILHSPPSLFLCALGLCEMNRLVKAASFERIKMGLKSDAGMQLDMVLRLGVSPDRIVFANACKRPRDIRAAANKQVLPLPLA